MIKKFPKSQSISGSAEGISVNKKPTDDSILDDLKATVLPMTKKRPYAVLNGHIFVIVRVRYIKVYIFKKRRN